MIDADVFGEFYARNYKLVYRVCYTYMQNRFDAEDCTEEPELCGRYGDHICKMTEKIPVRSQKSASCAFLLDLRIDMRYNYNEEM